MQISGNFREQFLADGNNMPLLWASEHCYVLLDHISHLLKETEIHCRITAKLNSLSTEFLV